MKNPLVSVLCITFNHGPFIANMLDGLLLQKTTFDVEYIVHDDASTDGTAFVMKEYESKYPGVFTMMYEEENQTKKGKKIFQHILLPKAKGKYIAICEGDDCWIDQNKLQEQVEFLEHNKEYVCVAHNALKVIDSTFIPFNMYEKSREVAPEDIIFRHFPYLPTSSKVFRREAFELDGFFLDSGFIGDIATEFNALTKGKIYYIDKIMSIYRFGVRGSYTALMSRWWELDFENRLRFYEFLSRYNSFTEGKYHHYISLYMSTTADDFIPKLWQRQVSYEEFVGKVKIMIEKQDKQDYVYWAKQLQRVIGVFLYGREEEYARVVKEKSKNGDIFVYGAGDFGMKLGNWLLNEKIPFAGYITTYAEGPQKQVLGKPIYDIKSIRSRIKEKDLIIVAVDADKWDGIHRVLVEEGIKNYVCPANIEPKG